MSVRGMFGLRCSFAMHMHDAVQLLSYLVPEHVKTVRIGVVGVCIGNHTREVKNRRWGAGIEVTYCQGFCCNWPDQAANAERFRCISCASIAD